MEKLRVARFDGLSESFVSDLLLLILSSFLSSFTHVCSNYFPMNRKTIPIS
jgi:hypothetical protein